MWIIPSFADVYGVDPNSQVKCPCSRMVFADALHDIRPLPVEKRIHGADFVCAGCVATMSRLGISTRTELYEGHHAPAEEMHHARLHDQDMAQTTHNVPSHDIARMLKSKRR
jgi:hypothetical protein